MRVRKKLVLFPSGEINLVLFPSVEINLVLFSPGEIKLVLFPRNFVFVEEENDKSPCFITPNLPHLESAICTFSHKQSTIDINIELIANFP